jgi:hypothetical protein
VSSSRISFVPGMQKTTTQSYKIDRMEISASLQIIICDLVQACLEGIGRTTLRYGTQGAKLCLARG